jgi:hypothetical protein
MNLLNRRTPMRNATIGAVLVGTVLLAGAGPLDPPAGGVAPTLKTLQEVEPRIALSATNTPGDAANVFIISQPGSYYLTGNVKPTGGRHAISVNADNVTIDLCGFALDGSADTTGFREGVNADAVRRNIVVRNGTIKNFRGYGIIGQFHTSCFEDLCFLDSVGGQLEIGASSGCIARNIRVRTTTGETGIQLGANSQVDNCTVEGGGVGISVASGVVRNCSVLNPGAVGISVNAGHAINCHVEGANSTSSIGNGGITGSTGSCIEGCTVRSCQSAGVNLNGRGQVINCEFSNCVKGVTTSLSGRGRIEGNQFTSCSTAAINLVNGGSIVVGNRFMLNTVNITAPAGNTIGEVLDYSAGGATLTAANMHPAANVAY